MAEGEKRRRKLPNRRIIAFFEFFCDPKNKETFRNGIAAATAAGFKATGARQAAWRILTKYESPESRQELLTLVGASQASLIANLASATKSRSRGGNFDKVSLLATAKLLAVHGVPTSDAVAIEQHNQTIHVDKMLIVGEHGATQEKLKSLTSGKDLPVRTKPLAG